MYDIQSYSEDINSLGETLATQNLTSYNQEEAGSIVKDFDSILNKALFLLQFVLPMSIILLSLIFYFVIWKLINNISLMKFFLYSISLLIMLLLTIYFTLSQIAYNYAFIEESPIAWLLISLFFLIIFYYFYLICLSTGKPLKECCKIGIKKLRYLSLFYILNIITNALYVLLIFVLFFLSFVGASIIIPSVSLLVVIIVINIQRQHLVKKISKIN